jgi:YHS domain-containing protein
LTKVPKTYNGKKAAFSVNVAGKTYYLPSAN